MATEKQDQQGPRPDCWWSCSSCSWEQMTAITSTIWRIPFCPTQSSAFVPALVSQTNSVHDDPFLYCFPPSPLYFWTTSLLLASNLKAASCLQCCSLNPYSCPVLIRLGFSFFNYFIIFKIILCHAIPLSTQPLFAGGSASLCRELTALQGALKPPELSPALIS